MANNDFFKTEQGPERLAGQTPKELLEGTEPTNVSPVNVAPELSGLINQSKGTTVNVGVSNTRYGVSSGLINALDVVQGISGTMQGAVKVRDSHDNWRLSQYETDLAKTKEQPDWEAKPAEEKLAAVREVQEKYKNKFLSQRARANMSLRQTDTEVELYEVEFQNKLSRIKREEARLAASGDLNDNEAFTEINNRYEALKKEYAGQETRLLAISMAQDQEAAEWAVDINSSANVAINKLMASGALETLFQELPTNVGYDTFRKRLLGDLAKQNKDNALGQALFASYDEASDEFTGPYAGILEDNLNEILHPQFDKAVQYQVKAYEGRLLMQMRDAQTITAARSYNQDPDKVAADLKEGLETTFRLSKGFTVAPTFEERAGMVENFAGGVFASWLQRNPSGNVQEMSNNLQKAILDNSDEIFAHMDISDPDEQDAFITGILSRIDLMVKDQNDARVEQQTKAFTTEASKVLEKQTAAMAAGIATREGTVEAINKSPYFQLLDVGAPVQFYSAPINYDGGDVDTQASVINHNQLQQQHMLQMGSEAIATALAGNGASAEQIQKAVKGWGELVQRTYASNPNAPGSAVNPSNLSALPAFLSAQVDDSVLQVQFDPRKPGEFSIVRNDANMSGLALNQAKFGALFRFMNYNPETKKYDPADGYKTLPIFTVLGNQATTILRDFNSNKDFALPTEAREEIVGMVSGMAAFLPDHTVRFAVRDALLAGVRGDSGQTNGLSEQQITAAVDAVTKNPTPENYDSLFGVLETLKAKQYGMFTGFGISPMSSREADVPTFFGAVFSTNPNAPVPTWKPEFDSINWGWGLYGGLDDDDALTFGQLISSDEYTVQVLSALGRETMGPDGKPILEFNAAGELTLSGTLQYSGMGSTADEARKKAAYDLNKALVQSGLQWVEDIDENGNYSNLRLKPRPKSVAFDENGMAVEKSPIVFDTAGETESFFKMHIDSESNDWIAKSVIRGVSRLGREGGNIDPEKAIRNQGWREAFISNWAVSGRSLFTNPEESRQNRFVLANQIEDTYSSYVEPSSWWDGIPDNVDEVLDFAQKLRSGNPIETNTIWITAQDWCTDNRLDPENPPLFAINLAIMAELTDTPAWLNVAPTDLIPQHVSPVGFDMDRGYTPRMFNLENFQELEASMGTRVGPLPLFAPHNVQGLHFDPKTFFLTLPKPEDAGYPDTTRFGGIGRITK